MVGDILQKQVTTCGHMVIAKQNTEREIRETKTGAGTDMTLSYMIKKKIYSWCATTTSRLDATGHMEF